jgi:arabinofuranosyltransferase
VFVRFWVAVRRAAPVLLLALPIVVLLAGAIDRRWMNEDGFINLRVVRNWLEGHGLVFNLDERIESTTSPLWLFVLALLGRIGIRLEYAAAFGGIVLTCAGLALAERAALFTHPRARPGQGLPLAIPVGAAIVAVLPSVWDYASSGLETGLCLAWLGGTYAIVAEAADAPAAGWRLRTRIAGAVLAGLGPLARPELALYAAPFVLLLAAAAWRSVGPQPTRIAWIARASGAALLVCVAAAAVPLGYEIFRMGYYASVLPNTAIAKEAFASNLKQGLCYFDNFFGTYRMGWPLFAAGAFALARTGQELLARRWSAAATTLAPVAAAALHVGYLVEIGGDYMHGRLVVPAVFGALLPVMAVPVPPSRPRFLQLPLLGAAAVAAVWLPMCALRFRVGVENVCNIGDERGWYTRKALEPNPVRIDDYRLHPFSVDAYKLERRVQDECKGEAAPPPGVVGCHRVYVESEDAQISPVPSSQPLAARVDGDVTAVVTAGAIGIVGYVLPDTVHVVDHHGLSDPIVGHFELLTRGRPGHEKKASAAWMLARFGAPSPDDDSGVVAARHALDCGILASMVRSTSGPLSVRGFFDNIAKAWDLSKLRIPHDPYEAEERFCGTPRGREFTTGGGGGTGFRWLCPAGRTLSGLRGTYAAKGKALATVQALCGAADAEEGAEALAGPRFGEAADQSFEVSCPPDAKASGFYGATDDMVHTVGVSCIDARGVERTAAGGVDGGRSFQVSCPGRGAVVGIVGRAGSLIDSLGVVCAR